MQFVSKRKVYHFGKIIRLNTTSNKFVVFLSMLLEYPINIDSQRISSELLSEPVSTIMAWAHNGDLAWAHNGDSRLANFMRTKDTRKKIFPLHVQILIYAK
jgi:hypothetical protein